VKNLWDDADAARHDGPLGPRVYTSRLLGRDPSLVLHGGGNTSLKLRERDVFGEEREVLYVKGSGCDLASIRAEDFVPLELAPVRRLASLPELSDAQLANELATRVVRAGAASPSVETLLHAIVPHAYVDHTHADALLSICNAPEGEARLRELYGEEAIVIPYRMAGFPLASCCAREFPRRAGAHTLGMVLMSHGVFSFGASARESYERMVRLVSKAEAYLESKRAWHISLPPAGPPHRVRGELAGLRREISAVAGFPLVARASPSPEGIAFARHGDLLRLTQSGPATPDHVLYTKPKPMIGRDVAAYAREYQAYFERHAPRANGPKRMLDPAPRVVLDAQLGLVSLGRSAREASIVEDLYTHTIDVILRAAALGGWNAISEQDIFDIEYWELERAKLDRVGAPPAFAGEVVLVTGAASGIGKACVDSFLSRGAAVLALDRNPAIEAQWPRPDVLGVTCDLTDRSALEAALERAERAYGGVDMLVLNAGIFPASAPIQEITPEAWQSAMTVNVEANLNVMQRSHALLQLAPRGGRVVVIGSRNVPAPGPGAAAYSASKAALVQLARVAALEWSKDGIRVNSLHPDAVYDTGLWSEALLASRAQAYGLTVEQYKRKNLLRTEVSSKDVAELAAEMCGPLFAKTTAAQVPVDGGNERVV
jgi:rhamnose utilization protein RhaD (predicted bifunctional aldolase and dehydrogenase)/NAD(P)-dependent dehydrogenase (short-subunit alcohol dehydrogenase family)